MRRYTNPPLPPAFGALVAQRCLGRLSDAALCEITHVLWSFHSRKKHVVNGSSKTISYQELYSRFGKSKGKNELLASGFFHVGKEWEKGRFAREITLTDLGRATLDEYIEMVTADPIEYCKTNHQALPASSFSSRDINGNQRKCKHPIRRLVPVRVDNLRAMANSPDADETHRVIAAQMISCTDSTGCLLQHYTEHRGARLFIHNAASLQNCPSEVRNCALAGSFDYDVVNCYPAIYGQVAERLSIPTPILNSYLKDKHHFLNELAEWMKCESKQVKAAILALQHFGGVKGVIEATSKGNCDPFTEAQAKRFISNPTIKPLRAEFMKVGRTWIAEASKRRGKTILNSMGKGVNRDEPQRKIISHLLQGVEAQIMEVCREHYADNILLLMHDGFVSSTEINIPWLERKIEQFTGYRIRLKCTPICPNSGVFKRTGSKPLQPACNLAIRAFKATPLTVKGKGSLGSGVVGVMGGLNPVFIAVNSIVDECLSSSIPFPET